MVFVEAARLADQTIARCYHTLSLRAARCRACDGTLLRRSQARFGTTAWTISNWIIQRLTLLQLQASTRET
jgi:ribosomal protein L40E